MMKNRFNSYMKYYTIVVMIFTSISILTGQCPTNDPALDNIDGIIPYTIHNVEEAWECTCGDENISVAVVDIHTALLHEDLQGKLTDFYGAMVQSSFAACNSGLAAAGIIGAGPNNGLASVGVGYDTKVGFFGLSMDECVIDSNDFFNVVQEAIVRGYRIINSTRFFEIQNNGQAALLSDFLENGGLLVVSGGQNAHAEYADWPGVINVGGMVSGDSDGEFIYQNIYAQEEEVPFDIFVSLEGMEGLQLFDQWGFTDNLLSENAAMVSATAALMLAVNDTLTGAEIEMIIKDTGKGEVVGVPGDSENVYLDVGAAVKGAANFDILDNVFEPSNKALTIHPNPASNYIILEEGVNEVCIIDLNGQKYYFNVNDGRVDISTLQNGVYFVVSKEGGISKFIKQ